jgi:phosphoribosyl-AMP cyclohydrolase / phosphoribosyl-ATP pyrophosphohydrolase
MNLVDQINWEKQSGLIPAIAQDIRTGVVLMLGYMNQEALQSTLQQQIVTFYSRSKQRLWTKGETSGNQLMLRQISLDCDKDTLLLQVEAQGPTCHTGETSCFANAQSGDWQVLSDLQQVIENRINTMPEQSYTADLIRKGINKIAQKVGEEAVEVVVASLAEDSSALIDESADLLFHLLVILAVRKVSIADVIRCLSSRKH